MIALAFWMLMSVVIVEVLVRPSDLDENWDNRQREIFAALFGSLFITSPIAFVMWLLTRRP